MEAKKARWTVLKLGDESDLILKARKLLKKHGSAIKQTGKKFDIGMFSAVQRFQRTHNLPVTGKIDKKTWDKMNVILCLKKKAK